VLDGLTFTIHQGEHTAILGPNGAGKTTLIRMLTLDDRPRASDNGTPALRLFGREHWDIGELSTRLGVVTGDLDATFGLNTSGGRVSGLDAAVSGLFGSHGVFSHHTVTAAMRDQGRAALARVEAPHLAGKPLNEMSTGERRRVLIARALVTQPEALVLDEPTTGLDLVARHRFMETVQRLTSEGTTLILITHHVDEIVPETRRVVLLREGKVAFEGAPEDALTPARLGQVFDASLTVERAGGYYHVRVSGSP
jgi:iron complex transport system ATP-binding protein